MVVDEADLLLTGGFQRDVRRVLDTMRTFDRDNAAGRACSQLGIDPTLFHGLPRHIRRAAYDGMSADASLADAYTCICLVLNTICTEAKL